MSNRRWYRLHLLTWLATLVVGAALVWSQIGWTLDAVGPAYRTVNVSRWQVYGWPFRMVWINVRRDWPANMYLIVDYTISLALVLGTAIAVERFMHRTKPMLQLRLAGLFGLTALVAALLAICRASAFLEEIELPSGNGMYGWVDWHPSDARDGTVHWNVMAPLLFGVGCTIYSAGWLVGRSVRAFRWLHWAGWPAVDDGHGAGDVTHNVRPTRTRSWLRYSLRTFLALVTLSGLVLGLAVRDAERQRRAVATIRANRGWLRYNYEQSFVRVGIAPLVRGELPGPDWLCRIIGVDYFADVTHASWGGAQDATAAHLTELTSLNWLNLRESRVTDAGLVHLRGLTSLECLWLDGTQVSDEGLAHLTGLRSLRFLSLDGTLVTNAGCQRLESALPNCYVIR